jgi:hypothetical protein
MHVCCVTGARVCVCVCVCAQWPWVCCLMAHLDRGQAVESHAGLASCHQLTGQEDTIQLCLE